MVNVGSGWRMEASTPFSPHPLFHAVSCHMDKKESKINELLQDELLRESSHTPIRVVPS